MGERVADSKPSGLHCRQLSVLDAEDAVVGGYDCFSKLGLYVGKPTRVAMPNDLSDWVEPAFAITRRRERVPTLYVLSFYDPIVLDGTLNHLEELGKRNDSN